MLGAIVGDIAGSLFEFDSNRNIAYSRNYPLISKISYATDDSIMTLAIADAVMKAIPKKGGVSSDIKFCGQVVASMRRFGHRYSSAGYGSRFRRWLMMRNPTPYESYGNGSAMRVSPIAWAFENLAEVEHYAELSARVTHNHPEGIKGAQATAGAIFLARKGYDKTEIRRYITCRYGYNLSRTLDMIRPTYHHVESCQETVPEAITAFLEGTDFEDVIRSAISLSGDADTLTAISGSIAEALYGIPDEINNQALTKLDDFLTDTLLAWEVWRGQVQM